MQHFRQKRKNSRKIKVCYSFLYHWWCILWLPKVLFLVFELHIKSLVLFVSWAFEEATSSEFDINIGLQLFYKVLTFRKKMWLDWRKQSKKQFCLLLKNDCTVLHIKISVQFLHGNWKTVRHCRINSSNFINGVKNLLLILVSIIKILILVWFPNCHIIFYFCYHLYVWIDKPMISASKMTYADKVSLLQLTLQDKKYEPKRMSNWFILSSISCFPQI